MTLSWDSWLIAQRSFGTKGDAEVRKTKRADPVAVILMHSQ